MGDPSPRSVSVPPSGPLQADPFPFAEKAVKDGWIYDLKRATIALCRLLPYSSGACAQLLTHYMKHPTILEVLRHQRRCLWQLFRTSSGAKGHGQF